MQLKSVGAFVALVFGLWAPPCLGNDNYLVTVKVWTTSITPDYVYPWRTDLPDESSGTACILEGNRLLTAAHIVADAAFVQVARAGGTKKYTATVEAIAHDVDLAVLRVADKAFFASAKPLALGNLPKLGDDVTVLGLPDDSIRLVETESSMARIKRTSINHAQFLNLLCEMDVEVEDGTSGGPVLHDGKLVAMVIEGNEDTTYAVPAAVIRHFLHDLKDGTVHGSPCVPLQIQTLENRQLRRATKIPDSEEGVIVRKIAREFSKSGPLMVGDVLLTIDGKNIANDGTISFRRDARVSFEYAIDRKQVGDSIAVRVSRGGEIHNFKLNLSLSKSKYPWLVQRRTYRSRPSYYIIGGLVFSVLTQNYLDECGGEDAPDHLLELRAQSRMDVDAGQREYVVLIGLLGADCNAGYEELEDSVVEIVNGKRIGSLRGFVAAIESHRKAFHLIRFRSTQNEIILDREAVIAESKEILARYRVPTDRSEDLKRTK